MVRHNALYPSGFLESGRRKGVNEGERLPAVVMAHSTLRREITFELIQSTLLALQDNWNPPSLKFLPAEHQQLIDE